jgi:hypothetical protein
MSAHLPSLAALVGADDDLLAAELRFNRLRSQVAVIRALADHVEHLARLRDSDGLTDQLIEELSRLGSRLLDAARPRVAPRES